MNLVRDLAIILVAAGTFTIISKALKQPLILGYIVAGFLIGPHLGLLPAMSGMESVNQWSEIGIIFLMFALGLEFSFKKLLKVGSSALIMAGCQCLGMMTLGLLVGKAMGWSTMESIFLGGLLSMSSTAIIIKAYDEMGLKRKPYASTVFGTLVVQDLIAILLMVLLSTMAVSNKFAGGEMLMGIAKLVFCLVLWFVVGMFIIPTILKKAHRYINDEILLIVSIGLCFAMVSIASATGFSSALGAFMMGSLLSETIEGENISKLVKTLKDLFGAIFFVSVGMMVDPSVIAQHWPTILILTFVAMSGITIFATSGALIAGKGLDNAVHCGFSLAQLGEFSFILAGLGTSLGVMREFIYPVVIAVSVITTFATPYMIKAADPVSLWLHHKLPAKTLEKLVPAVEDHRITSAAEQSIWSKLLKGYFLQLALYCVLLTAIFIGSSLYLDGFVTRILPSASPVAHHWIDAMLTLAMMVPLMIAMVVNRGDRSKLMAKLVADKQSNKFPLLALIFLKIAIAMTYFLAVLVMHFDMAAWTILVIIVAGDVLLLIMRRTAKSFTKIQQHFIDNLNSKEEEERRNSPVTTSVKDKFAGYDVHIEAISISPDSSFVGKKLMEIPFRKVSGVNIVKIQRGSRSIIIPSGDEVIYPHDRVLAVGTTAQIEAFREMMEQDMAVAVPSQQGEFVVEPVTLDENSVLVGKNLINSGMRNVGCMVISVQRKGVLMTNPKPDMEFAAGDVVWLAGERQGCEWYK